MAADRFIAWHWTTFWQRHEAPLVRLWLQELTPGSGLDAGAGLGPYLGDALAAGHRCVAIDISMKMLKAGVFQRQTFNRRRPGWVVQGDARSLPLPNGHLDWVLTTRVLSNNAEPERILTELARVMKSGAACLITDVHPDHPYDQMSIRAGDRVLPIETHRHATTQIIALASRSFKMEHFGEYRLKDLTRPPSRSLFRKIYEKSSAPIFYTIRLRRESRVAMRRP